MQSLRHIYGRGRTRTDQLFHQQWQKNAQRTDRMFAVLLVLEWLAAMIVSWILSPRTWNGTESRIHPHVWFSIFIGGALAIGPVYLAWRLPGRAATRHVIALAQILFSSLLIQVSGGRIETHFHVFGSLAFLAFYRDWSVLIPATLLVAVDHFVRGVYWPATVFGIAAPDPWRWVEHAAWVIYEDFFLILACRHGVREMWASAERTAELERINREIQQQTTELKTAYSSKQAIVATALDAVVGMDGNGNITGWNPQAETVFGWQADEVIGRALADTIIPQKFREMHRAGLQRYLDTGESSVLNRRIEVTAVHRDGHEFPVELAVSPILTENAVSFCAFIRDITVRLQGAEALRTAKEAAEAASLAKSAFLANMSHEIRTPLNGILGFADLLLKHINGDVEERRDHLQTIHDSGRHLLTVINDVLDLSKIESGQMEVERAACSPHDIISSTVSVLRVRARERGVNLEYFWKNEVPESVQTDPLRFRQILMNLIGNAIKFTEVGSVQVAARLQPGGSPQIVVDVIDTGVGIESSAVERIFDPFVQADTSITRRFGGTGLGLSISRRLARLLGGDITVNSEPGRGSIFSLMVPTGSLAGVRMTLGAASDSIAEAPIAERTATRSLHPSRILLVEDGVTNRKLIKLVLEQAGAEVCYAENGQAGVEAACSGPFDLVLMDMQMPVMDGYTATRALRRQGYQGPIIALTAHAMAGDEAKCREAGCSGYLTKPIDQSRMLAAVADALGMAASGAVGQPESGAPQRILTSTLPLDDPDFREIVEEFIARFDEKMAALRAAWRDRDVPQIGQIAHWIRGSGGTAGFDALTQPAASLEHCANTASLADMEQHLQRLEDLLCQIRVPLAVS